jgi:hypothetical protein
MGGGGEDVTAMAVVMYSSVMFVHEEEEDLALGGLGRSNGPAQLGRFLFF